MTSAFFENPVDFGHLYLNANDADVFFVVSDDQGLIKRVPAHKSVLARQSKVFKSMLEGELKESGDIHLLDVSVFAFCQFLEFFYLSLPRVTIKHASEVMILGDRYDVEICVQSCATFLIERINDENVVDILHHAIMLQQTHLANSCEEYIASNTSAVLKSTGFKESHKIVLECILKMDSFSCGEREVFIACMEWVKAKGDERILSKEKVEKYLGDLFYAIRFASMNVEELCHLPTEYEPILTKDFQTIAKMIMIPTFKPKMFNPNLRKITSDEN